MRKFWTTTIVTALGAAAFSQVIYLPARTIKDQNLTVNGWGSGLISETDETSYEGGYSIRISSRNFFQGGLINFGSPTDWNKAFGDNSNLLRITFRVADQSMTLGGGNTGGGGGKGKGPGDDAGLAGGGAGSRGTGGGQGSTAKVDNTMQRLRMIVTTTDGLKSEAYVTVSTTGSTSGWRNVAIPLRAINGFEKTNKIVKQLGFSADTTSTFYIGDLRMMSDTTPISGELKTGNLNLALGDEVEFRASGFGGASVLKYSWDFNKKDGIQEDAEGAVVRRKFRVAGTYEVTVTISDTYGLKKPYTASIQVVVNP